jgi:hypothetical protein
MGTARVSSVMIRLLDYRQDQRVPVQTSGDPLPAADRPIKPPIAGLRDPQRSFDLVDATQVLIDP